MKNIQLESLIKELKKTAIDKDAKIWKRIASDLERPARRRCEVNLSKIDRYAKANETIIVPGKVLGMGSLNKKVIIAAYKFSKQAKEKIESNGSKSMTISELLQSKPKGNIKIMG